MQVWNGDALGFDVYLPGTLLKAPVAVSDAFPNYITTQRDANSDSIEEELRQNNAIARRRNPSCFEEACAYGNLQVAVLQWAQGFVDIPTRCNIYEGTDAPPLMWAALRGHLPIVRFLIDQGAPINATNAIGHTALHWSITSNRMDVARFLLDHGADPSIRDQQGFDAAFHAACAGNLAILALLVEEAVAAEAVRLEGGRYVRTDAAAGTGAWHYYLDPSLRDTEGHSLLHWAAYRNTRATCQYLVEYWNYGVNVTDQHGRTPLTWAAREGFAVVLEYLLERGADRNVVDCDGYTALGYAKSRNHPDAVYVLENFPRWGAPAAEKPAPQNVDSASEGLLKAPPDEAGVPAAVHIAGAPLGHRFLRRLGWRYATVRERRAAGTLRMMLQHKLFALQAVAGVGYVLLGLAFMWFFPPVFSYFPFGIYFFKNVVWTHIVGHPVQGSDKQCNHGKVAIPTNFADSVRGTWRFRLREPCNWFALLSLLLLQLVAWHGLGLSSIALYTMAGLLPRHETGALPGSLRDEMLGQQQYTHPLSPERAAQLENTDFYLGGWLLGPLFNRSAPAMVSAVLSLLLVATITCMALCKYLAMRSALGQTEESTLQSSPLWHILRRRAYRWLHPRCCMLERHTLIPLRAFYCAERDVIVQRYDGYSILLDCPIGARNHVAFVLGLTCLALFEFLLFMWGLHQTTVYMSSTSPIGEPWHTGAWLGFQNVAGLSRYLSSLTAYQESQGGRGGGLPPASSGAAVAYPSWLNTLAHVLFHGLPSKQSLFQRKLIEAELAALSDGGHWGVLRRTFFAFRYYVWPTQSSSLGVWVFHASLLVCVMATYVALRQWRGVWCGATRMEMANPLAPGEQQNGGLVAIFPHTQHESLPCSIDPDEERYYAAVDPSKARAVPMPSCFFDNPCIYADSRFGLVNVLLFLLGRSGRRWSGATAVAAQNAPVKRVLPSLN